MIRYSIPTRVTFWIRYSMLGAAMTLIASTGACSRDGDSVIPNQDGEPSAIEVELRAELQRILEAQRTSGKQIAFVPIELARGIDYDETTRILRWGYGLGGDYDLNGEVNVNDLTPIAQLFGRTGGFEWTGAREGWVDGDQNGEINASDMMLLASTFGQSLMGYRLIAADTLDPGASDAGFDVIAEFALKRDGDAWPPSYQVLIPEGYRFVQLEPLNAPGERILRSTLDTLNPDGNFRDFTDPRTGETYRIVDGQVNIGFKPSLDSPAVEQFIADERLVVFNVYPPINGVTAYLPPETSVEYAVGEWPGLYPDLIEVVDPNGVGRTPQ